MKDVSECHIDRTVSEPPHAAGVSSSFRQGSSFESSKRLSWIVNEVFLVFLELFELDFVKRLVF